MANVIASSFNASRCDLIIPAKESASVMGGVVVGHTVQVPAQRPSDWLPSPLPQTG